MEIAPSRCFIFQKGKLHDLPITLQGMMMLNYRIRFATRFCTKKMTWQNLSSNICEKYISLISMLDHLVCCFCSL